MTNGCATKLPEHAQLAEINPASDTGQRWWHGQHSWVRRSEGGFNPDLYEVHPINDKIAKSYVKRMHYSGSYVAASRRYGMFIHTEDGPDLVGVAVFAIPAQVKVLTNVFPELRPYVESLELARFVLEGQPLRPAGEGPVPAQRAPGNAETWFLRECLRYLADAGTRRRRPTRVDHHVDPRRCPVELLPAVGQRARRLRGRPHRARSPPGPAHRTGERRRHAHRRHAGTVLSPHIDKPRPSSRERACVSLPPAQQGRPQSRRCRCPPWCQPRGSGGLDGVHRLVE